jgi:hypothetical protein
MDPFELKALVNLLMVSDPWPLTGRLGPEQEKLLKHFADVESRKRSYKDWVDAYHGLSWTEDRDIGQEP